MFERLVLNKYTIGGALALLLLASGYGYYKHSLNKAAEGARTAQIEKQVAAYNVDLAKSLTASKELVETLQSKLKDLQDAKDVIESQRDSAIVSLRNRPTRAETKISSSADTTPAPQTCTGSELSREDAEFLTREAARAELIIKERDFYYDRYEQSRTRLEALARTLN